MLIDKIRKPLPEVMYLNVDNVFRYRLIMRSFYEEYNKLNYWLSAQEVYGLCEEHLPEYSFENCCSDLEKLVEWGNLDALQDTKSILTLEDFRNKRYRFQMSKYSVEIERLLVNLETMASEKGSLEPSLLERLLHDLELLTDLSRQTDEVIFGWWENLSGDFRNINERYQDFLRDLNSITMDRAMSGPRFLLMKDRIIEYLRHFIRRLHTYESDMKRLLSAVDAEQMECIFAAVIRHRKSIPGIEILDEEVYEEAVRGRWKSVNNWFLGTSHQESELVKIFRMADEIILKISRFALQIAMEHSGGVNRKELYLRLAEFFYSCEDIQECHQLSARSFGIKSTYHLRGDTKRSSESTTSSVYEDTPLLFELKPRIRHYGQKAQRTPIADKSQEKKKRLRMYQEEERQRRQILESLMQDGVIDFSRLGTISSQTRKVLLAWVSLARQNASRRAGTQDGRSFLLRENPEEKVTLHCEDGHFVMPACILEFEP